MPTAFVLMKCRDDTADAIRAMTRENIEVLPTIGHYDLITKVTSESSHELNEIIEEIRRYDRVRSVNVLRAGNEDAVAAVLV